MTEEEYQAEKAVLDTQQAELSAQQEALEHERLITQGPQYPTWVYHPIECAKIVQTEAEFLALGRGWTTSPTGPTTRKEP